MSDKITELTLNLILLDEESVKSTDSVNKYTDSWFENDDPTLLGEQAESTHHEVLNINPTISVSSLRIRQKENEFRLTVEKGDVALKNSDIIKVGSQYYQVHIEKEYIVPAEHQEETFFDTLSFDYYNKPRVEQDPLGFLYGEQSQKHHAMAYQSYDAFSQTNKKTLPYDQVPTLNSHISTFPSYIKNEDRRRAIPQDVFDAKQGNVLNDLGIDENNTTIMHKEFKSGKSSYADQSPADMIDEYLNLQEISLAPSAYQTVKNNKKKFIPNIFTGATSTKESMKKTSRSKV